MRSFNNISSFGKMVNIYDEISINKRVPDIAEAVDPDMVTWHNLGNYASIKCVRYLIVLSIITICYGLSYQGIKSIYEADTR